MSNQSLIKAQLESAKTAAHTEVGASFAALGTPLANPAQVLLITNTCNDGSGNPIAVWLSIDGSTDQFLVAGNQQIEINVAANKQGTSQFAFPKGTQFYVKQGPDGAPSGGDISVTAIYGGN